MQTRILSSLVPEIGSTCGQKSMKLLSGFAAGFKILCGLVLLFTSFSSEAQVSFAGSYSENFNSFSGGTAPTGWSYTGTFRGTGTGTSNTGGAWCYGSGSDWSMGLLHSSSAGTISITGSFTNATASTITALKVSYNFEQWRYANTSGLLVSAAGALAGASATIGAALSGSGSASGSSGTVTTTPKTVSLTGISIAPGATFSITWTVDDPSGADNGVSVDDFVLCIPNASFPVTAGNTSPVGTGTSFSLSSVATGLASPFTYSWTGPAGSGFSSTAQNPVIPAGSVTSAYDGTYSVVATDANTCTSLATTIATVTAVTCTVPPTAVSATPSSTSLCSGATLTLTGAATGAASYSWSGPGGYSAAALSPAGITVTAASAGIYTLVATNSCGSTTVTTSPVAITTTPAGLLATSSATTLCSGDVLTLTGAATGATSFSWSGPGGYSAAVVNPPSFVVSTSSTGIYSFTATNSCGSATTTTGTITVNTIPLSVSAAASSTALCSGNTITLTGSASGATSYSWSGPGGYSAAILNPSGFTATTLSAGIYTLTATNACGTTTANTAAVTVLTVPTAVTASLSATPVCSGDALTLTGTATGATTYSWSGPNSYTAALLNPAAVITTSLSGGVYTLTATNTCGNTTATTGLLTVNTAPTLVAAAATPTTLCSGDQLTLTGMGTSGIVVSYSWAGPNGYTSLLQNPAAITTSALSAGIYTLSATNSCGTTTATTASVTVNTVPTAVTATLSTAALCNGNILTLSGSATSPVTTTYSWIGPNSFTSTDLNPAGITTSTLSAGVYTLSATNVCGSTIATTGSLIVNTAPTAVIATAAPTTLCAGDALTLAGAASSTISTSYSWAGPGGYIAAALNPAALTTTLLSAGVYTLTATNVCGSTMATSAPVIVNAVPLSVTATPSATTLCSGSTLTLTGAATNATSYSWAGPGGFSSTSLNPAGIITTTLSAGVYTLTATNTCGSTLATTSSVFIRTVPTSVTASAAPTTLCSGNPLSVSGTATGAISYSWSGPNGYSSANLNPSSFTTSTSSSGAYTLTATNICGSTVATTVPVTVNTTPTAVAATASSAAVCDGASITLTGVATSAISTTYSWAGPDGYTSTDLNPAAFATTPLASGVYTLTATNVCGSASANTVPVTIISAPAIVSVNTIASSLCTGASLSLVGAATGATIYQWSGPGAYNATLLNPPAFTAGTASSGTYTLAAGNTCFTVTATASVIFTSLPTMGPITGMTTICQGNASVLSDTVLSGVWTSGAAAVATVSSTGVVTGVAAGSAIISYTNTNACGTALATTTVTILPLPVPAPVTGASAICQGSSSSYLNSITGGVWSSSNTSIVTIDAAGVATGSAAGVATISYTVNNGCGVLVTDTMMISVITVPDAGSIFGAVRVCPGDTIRLFDHVVGGSWHVTNGRASITAAGGLVTGIVSGLDTAFYVVANFCGSDTAWYPFYMYTASECAALGVTPVTTTIANCGIYPNPNMGSFTLSGTWVDGDNQATIEIVDLLGQVVYRKDIVVNNGNIDEHLDASENLSTGIYILRINSANAQKAIRFTTY